MAGLLESDTVAAISLSTGCYGPNLAPHHSIFFFSLVWLMWLSLCFFYPVNVSLLHANVTPAYISTYAFSHASGWDHHGRCYICSHRRGGLTLQSGASGSPRSLPLPQRLGALGRRQELINDNARSAGGKEPRLAREQRCRGCYCTALL